MFDFLRSKSASEPEAEQMALPEPADEADPAVQAAVEAALIEHAEPEPEPAPEPARPVTLVTADTTIGGSIETRSDVVVQGVVGGDLTSGALVIEVDGRVEGNVVAAGDVVVQGTVRGNVTVQGKITIAATGKVIGDVNAHAIALDEGGELHGRCTMGAPKKVAREAEPDDDSFIGKMLEDDDVSFVAPELAVV